MTAVFYVDDREAEQQAQQPAITREDYEAIVVMRQNMTHVPISQALMDALLSVPD